MKITIRATTPFGVEIVRTAQALPSQLHAFLDQMDQDGIPPNGITFRNPEELVGERTLSILRRDQFAAIDFELEEDG